MRRARAVGHLAIATTPTEAPRRVLLVDGDTNQRRALAIGLRLHGHLAEELGSGAECLASAELLGADLVVVARFLPDMRGEDLAELLSRMLPNARIALVAHDVDDEQRRPSDSKDFASTAIIPRPLRTEDLLTFLSGAAKIVA